MACVCRILKLTVDFTSFGNVGRRAYWKSLQRINICASGASNGVFYSNAAVELQQETSFPQGETAAAVSGENALNLGWKETSRRTGVIAIKLGMTQLWNKEGYPVAVTVLQVSLVPSLEPREVWVDARLFDSWRTGWKGWRECEREKGLMNNLNLVQINSCDERIALHQPTRVA